VFVAFVVVVVAYLVGMFPTAQLVGRRTGRDPTAEGSGNPGASNVWRLSGRRAGAIVGLVDLLKGAVPTLVALLAAGRPVAHAAWVAAVAGHVWPVTRRLRGGKGVATAGGGGIVLGPVIGILCSGLFLVTVKLGRIAALGSIAIAVGYPVLAAIVGRPGWEVATAVGVGAIVVIRHQSNIRRLIGGAGATTDRSRRR
jgi:glycerol-3-phosphate acyltransferase PlsY